MHSTYDGWSGFKTPVIGHKIHSGRFVRTGENIKKEKIEV